MTKVLVVNHAWSEICGIHGLGRRIYEALHRLDTLEVSYADCGHAGDYLTACQTHQPDAVIVNYRSDLMGWVSSALPLWPAVTFGTIHNYDAHNVDAYGQEPLSHGFSYALVLDPTVTPTDPRVVAIGRALPPTPTGESPRHDPPWIGSFGFAFDHKGFVDVAVEINDSLEAAVYTLHMPEAYFNGMSGAPNIAPRLAVGAAAALTKPGMELRHTDDHIPDDEVVARLALNDVNCLFYVPGQPDPGMSSALDYLIAAQRPILMTDCAMFRYAVDAAAVWPHTHLAEVVADWDRWQVAVEALCIRTRAEFDDVSWLLDRLP